MIGVSAAGGKLGNASGGVYVNSVTGDSIGGTTSGAANVIAHNLAIGIDLEAGVCLADRYPFIYATIGVHPHDAANATAETYRRLSELTAHAKVIAIGEIGLDFHYDHSPRQIQRDVFVEQMRIARDALRRLASHGIEGADWAGGLEARSRALVTDGADAERWYVEASQFSGVKSQEPRLKADPPTLERFLSRRDG